jgi:hypothetical protein
MKTNKDQKGRSAFKMNTFTNKTKHRSPKTGEGTMEKKIEKTGIS